MTRIVHLKKELYDILIDRRTKWGNPFILDKDGDRETVIKKYKTYLLNNESLMKALPELKDKILGCWCKPLACHGDILVEMVNKL